MLAEIEAGPSHHRMHRGWQQADREIGLCDETSQCLLVVGQNRGGATVRMTFHQGLGFGNGSGSHRDAETVIEQIPHQRPGDQAGSEHHYILHEVPPSC